jgi:hypothetical protein
MRNLILTSVAATALVAASAATAVAQRSEQGERPGAASSQPGSVGTGGEQKGRSPAQSQRAPDQGTPKAGPAGRDRATTGATGSEEKQPQAAPKGDRLDRTQKQQPGQPGASSPARSDKAQSEQKQQGVREDMRAKDRQPPAAATQKSKERSTTGQSQPGTDQGRTGRGQERATQPGVGEPGRATQPPAGRSGQEGQTIQREQSGQTTTAPSGRSKRDNRTGSRQDTSTTTSTSTNVSPEVQTRFSNVIERQRVRSVDDVNISVSVGAPLPRSVRAYDVPRDIVDVYPEYRSKRYTVVRDEIVIIEPRTNKVISVIPRSGRTTTGTTSRQSTSTRIQLAPEQRRMIRETVIKEQSVPRCDQVQISVGQDIPRSIELRTFSEDIVRDVPEIRSYRFCVKNEEVLLIDPNEYRIVEIIE